MYLFCTNIIIKKVTARLTEHDDVITPLLRCAPRLGFTLGTALATCQRPSVSKAAFVHMRPAQLCTENGVSICMYSAVEVAWLAQNFRHSSTRV